MRYLWSTLKHKWFVFLACQRMGVPIWRAIIHDWTKFLPAELPHYDRQFFGDKSDPDGFARAWLHHQNSNPHHWEYWITRSEHSIGNADVVDGCVPMPETYVREMIADWLGASRAYLGTWDIHEWLERKLARIKVHPDTRDLIIRVIWTYLDGYDMSWLESVSGK